MEAASALLAAYDQSLATTLPATGADRFALLDGCYLGDGASKAYLVVNYETTGAAAADNNYSRAFSERVLGSRRSNLKVLAERASSNADDSARREIDIQYDIAYANGTTELDVKDTVIVGSSAGSCAAANNKTSARFFRQPEARQFELDCAQS